MLGMIRIFISCLILVLTSVGVMAFQILQTRQIPKENMVYVFDKTIQSIGEMTLSQNKELQGTRTFGKDTYTGKYIANYQNFSGTENVFGGTTLKRKEGNNVHINIKIKNSRGNVQVIARLQDKEEVLADQDGTFAFDFDVETGSNYCLIKMEQYSGNIEIEIQ